MREAGKDAGGGQETSNLLSPALAVLHFMPVYDVYAVLGAAPFVIVHVTLCFHIVYT